jgi:hypothetical protein
MTWNEQSWLGVAAYPLALALGLLVAWFAVAAPFGDDTSKVTVLLWLVSAGILGLLQPHQPWRWALAIGPWVSVIHGIRHALDLPATINPNTYTTILILVPVSLVVCLLGAYGGSWLRWAVQRS